MDSVEEFLQENVGCEGDEDPNTFKEILEPEEYIDLGHLFTTDRIFSLKDELVDWAKQTAMKAKTYLIINRYQRSRTADRRPYVTLACERRVEDEEEEIPIKRRGPYGTKKCRCPFKLKGEQMAINENWQLFVPNGRHNHKIAIYNHSHAQAARLTEEQLQQTGQIRKSHVPPHNILRFFREQDVGCAVSAQKIYNVVAKIKKNRMQGRNTVEEVLCLSTQWSYTVFYRTVRRATNRVESEHSLLKLWLSTCHGDLDIVFLNIDSLIEVQIAEIKTSLEISKLKEKYAAKSNVILTNISKKISHLALKKIWLEIKKAREMVENSKNKCLHYLRKSHGLPCACETGW
ncbi:hypothetical protein M9H77_13004 [Catharanthus roseus]|uniref:Uncharacterized protein n=1 Tax=Catharanthus roseus TaxID=4058 RepID=A0ACC0BJ21_CATRO|nr:hypothetical protein M9H77_13004 [Catharanthus roseus]